MPTLSGWDLHYVTKLGISSPRRVVQTITEEQATWLLKHRAIRLVSRRRDRYCVKCGIALSEDLVVWMIERMYQRKS